MKLFLLSAPVYYHILHLPSGVSDLHLHLLLLSPQAPLGGASSALKYGAAFSVNSFFFLKIHIHCDTWKQWGD